MKLRILRWVGYLTCLAVIWMNNPGIEWWQALALIYATASATALILWEGK